MENRHVIGEVVFDLRFDLHADAAVPSDPEQSTLASFLQSAVLPLVEQVFDALSPPGSVASIDTLEIDLGDLDLDTYRAVLPGRFRDSLRAVLAGKIDALRQAPAAEDYFLDAEQAGEAELLHFLETGRLLRTQAVDQAAITALFAQVLGRAAPAFITTLRQSPQRTVLAARMARQLDGPSRDAMVRLLAAGQAPALLDRLAAWGGRNSDRLASQRSIAEIQAWEAVFETLLSVETPDAALLPRVEVALNGLARTSPPAAGADVGEGLGQARRGEVGRGSEGRKTEWSGEAPPDFPRAHIDLKRWALKRRLEQALQWDAGQRLADLWREALRVDAAAVREVFLTQVNTRQGWDRLAAALTAPDLLALSRAVSVREADGLAAALAGRDQDGGTVAPPPDWRRLLELLYQVGQRQITPHAFSAQLGALIHPLASVGSSPGSGAGSPAHPPGAETIEASDRPLEAAQLEVASIDATFAALLMLPAPLQSLLRRQRLGMDVRRELEHLTTVELAALAHSLAALKALGVEVAPLQSTALPTLQPAAASSSSADDGLDWDLNRLAAQGPPAAQSNSHLRPEDVASVPPYYRAILAHWLEGQDLDPGLGPPSDRVEKPLALGEGDLRPAEMDRQRLLEARLEAALAGGQIEWLLQAWPALLRDHPERIRAAFFRHMGQGRLRRRLVSRLPDALLRQLVAVLLPSLAGALLDRLTACLSEQAPAEVGGALAWPDEASPPPTPAFRARYLAAWEFTLAYLHGLAADVVVANDVVAIDDVTLDLETFADLLASELAEAFPAPGGVSSAETDQPGDGPASGPRKRPTAQDTVLARLRGLRPGEDVTPAIQALALASPRMLDALFDDLSQQSIRPGLAELTVPELRALAAALIARKAGKPGGEFLTEIEKHAAQAADGRRYYRYVLEKLLQDALVDLEWAITLKAAEVPEASNVPDAPAPGAATLATWLAGFSAVDAPSSPATSPAPASVYQTFFRLMALPAARARLHDVEDETRLIQLVEALAPGSRVLVKTLQGVRPGGASRAFWRATLDYLHRLGAGPEGKVADSDDEVLRFDAADYTAHVLAALADGQADGPNAAASSRQRAESVVDGALRARLLQALMPPPPRPGGGEDDVGHPAPDPAPPLSAQVLALQHDFARALQTLDAEQITLGLKALLSDHADQARGVLLAQLRDAAARQQAMAKLPEDLLARLLDLAWPGLGNRAQAEVRAMRGMTGDLHAAEAVWRHHFDWLYSTDAPEAVQVAVASDARLTSDAERTSVEGAGSDVPAASAQQANAANLLAEVLLRLQGEGDRPLTEAVLNAIVVDAPAHFDDLLQQLHAGVFTPGLARLQATELQALIAGLLLRNGVPADSVIRRSVVQQARVAEDETAYYRSVLTQLIAEDTLDLEQALEQARTPSQVVANGAEEPPTKAAGAELDAPAQPERAVEGHPTIPGSDTPPAHDATAPLGADPHNAGLLSQVRARLRGEAEGQVTAALLSALAEGGAAGFDHLVQGLRAGEFFSGLARLQAPELLALIASLLQHSGVPADSVIRRSVVQGAGDAKDAAAYYRSVLSQLIAGDTLDLEQALATAQAPAQAPAQNFAPAAEGTPAGRGSTVTMSDDKTDPPDSTALLTRVRDRLRGGTADPLSAAMLSDLAAAAPAHFDRVFQDLRAGAFTQGLMRLQAIELQALVASLLQRNGVPADSVIGRSVADGALKAGKAGDAAAYYRSVLAQLIAGETLDLEQALAAAQAYAQSPDQVEGGRPVGQASEAEAEAEAEVGLSGRLGPRGMVGTSEAPSAQTAGEGGDTGLSTAAPQGMDFARVREAAAPQAASAQYVFPQYASPHEASPQQASAPGSAAHGNASRLSRVLSRLRGETGEGLSLADLNGLAEQDPVRFEQLLQALRAGKFNAGLAGLRAAELKGLVTHLLISNGVAADSALHRGMAELIQDAGDETAYYRHILKQLFAGQSIDFEWALEHALEQALSVFRDPPLSPESTRAHLPAAQTAPQLPVEPPPNPASGPAVGMAPSETDPALAQVWARLRGEIASPVSEAGLLAIAAQHPADFERLIETLQTAVGGQGVNPLHTDELKAWVAVLLQRNGVPGNSPIHQGLVQWAQAASDPSAYYGHILRQLIAGGAIDLEAALASAGQSTQAAGHAAPLQAKVGAEAERVAVPTPQRAVEENAADTANTAKTANTADVASSSALSSAPHPVLALLVARLRGATAPSVSEAMLAEIAEQDAAAVDRVLEALQAGAIRPGLAHLHGSELQALIAWRLQRNGVATASVFALNMARMLHTARLAPHNVAIDEAAYYRHILRQLIVGGAIDLEQALERARGRTGSPAIEPPDSSRAPERDQAQAKAAEQPRPEPTPTLASMARAPDSGPWNRPQPRPQPRDLYVANAGLVLVAPYLPHLFSRLGLTGAQGFVDHAAAERAVHLSQYVVDECSDAPEFLLPLNRILCGVPENQPMIRQIHVTDIEHKTVEEMLKAVISAWRVIGNTSVDGLRSAFLQRAGRLNLTPDGWHLEVDGHAIDVLLDQLPWSLAIVKYSWMPQPLRVEWRK